MLSKLRGEIYLLSGALLFSFNGIISKIVLVDGLSAWRLTQIRTGGAFVILFAIYFTFRRSELKTNKKELPWLIAFGVVGVALVQAFYFVAIERLYVGVALLIEFTAPTFDDIINSVNFIDGEITNQRSVYIHCSEGISRAATIAVASTSTSLPGTDAQVTNSGTSSNVQLNFVIPRGADGAPGAPGAAGAPGAQGATGATPSLDPISTRISLTMPNTSTTGVNSNWYPLSTGLYDLGKDATSGAARYWKNIYSNGTIYAASVVASGNMFIQTSTIVSSDRTLKNTIEESDLGLNFINALKPVSYKYNVGGINYSTDDDGNQVETIIPGSRTHYGLIAQEVKEALEEAGVSDFGGWVEKEDSTQALRYEEFISPLIKAVQELSARVKALEEA